MAENFVPLTYPLFLLKHCSAADEFWGLDCWSSKRFFLYVFLDIFQYNIYNKFVTFIVDSNIYKISEKSSRFF